MSRDSEGYNDLGSIKALDEAIERFKYVVREEDYRGGQQIQLGMNTDANSAFIFGRNEVSPQNFHTALDYFLSEHPGHGA